MPRYVFLLPQVAAPTGGVAVALDCADMLGRAGYEVAVLQGSARYRYAFGDAEVVRLVDPLVPLRIMLATIAAQTGWKARVQWAVSSAGRILGHLAALPFRGRSPLRPDDVLVVPEIWWAQAVRLFGRHRQVLLAQGSHLLLLAWREAVCRQRLRGDFLAVVATSERCAQTARALGLAPLEQLPLAVDSERFAFAERKRLAVAYMPRKRPAEAAVMAELLRRRGKLEGVDLIAIDRMPQDEVARHMRDSLVFASLPLREGFGLPIAEAMASGCVVVGYTGQGAEEFFDDTTGVPIEDSDLLQLVESVEAVVAEYRRDPARLDALRAAGAQRVRSRYTREAMRAGLLAAWDRIDSLVEGAGRPLERSVAEEPVGKAEMAS